MGNAIEKKKGLQQMELSPLVLAKEQALLTFLEYMSSLTVFRVIHVAKSLVFVSVL